MQSRFSEMTYKLILFASLYIGAIAFFKNSVILSWLYALPSFLIISYGCYSLVSIGKSVSQIEEHPKETQSLLADIKEAREFAAKHLNK